MPENFIQSGYSLPLFELYEDKNYILVLTKPLTLQGRDNYLINKKTLEGIHIKGSARVAVEGVMFLEGRLMPDIIDSNRNEFISWFAPIWINCMREEIFAKNLDVKLYKKEMRTFFEKADRREAIRAWCSMRTDMRNLTEPYI